MTVQVIDSHDGSGWGGNFNPVFEDFSVNYYNGSIRFAASQASGEPPRTGRWTFTVEPGLFRVSTTWFPNPNRATNAPFVIKDNATVVSTVAVNQELFPNGGAGSYQGSSGSSVPFQFIDGGAALLIESTTLIVELSNNANEFVMADAVRIERVGGLPSSSSALPILQQGLFVGQSL